MIRVNLLSNDRGRGQSGLARWLVVPPEQRAALFGVTVLLATALGVAGWWWSLDLERQRLETEIAAREASLVQLQEAARLVEQATAREKDLRDRLSLIDRLRATQRAPVVLLETVSDSLPDGVWLLELRQTGAIVQIEGRAVSLSALADFVDRLQVSQRFVQALDILTTNMETLGETSVVRFAVRGEVRGVTAAVAAPARGGV